MKILALQSKSNKYATDTIICQDDEVEDIIAKKKDCWNIVVNDWFGNGVGE